MREVEGKEKEMGEDGKPRVGGETGAKGGRLEESRKKEKEDERKGRTRIWSKTMKSRRRYRNKSRRIGRGGGEGAKGGGLLEERRGSPRNAAVGRRGVEKAVRRRFLCFYFLPMV